MNTNNAATVHPSPKVRSLTVPVNVEDPTEGERAIRETLKANGRTLVEGSACVLRITDAVPQAQAAITFPGSTKCFVFRVEYTVDVGR